MPPNAPETELPFAVSLATITGEILQEESPIFSFDKRNVRSLTDSLRDKDGRGSTPRMIVDRVEPELSYRSSVVVSVVLNDPRSPIAVWSDTDRRYLLDRALGIEIDMYRRDRHKGQTVEVYYPGTYPQSTAAAARLEQLEGLQARLRLRATPTPPIARR